MLSLFELQRDAVVSLLQHTRPASGSKAFLVVDPFTQKYIYNLISREELLEYVFAVVLATDKRLVNMTYECVYILLPNALLVLCLVSDFKPLPMRYKRGHVFFTPGPVDKAMEPVYREPNWRAYVQGPYTLPWAMQPVEPRAFVVPRTPVLMATMSSTDTVQLASAYIDRCVESLVELCVLLGEFPLIRYHQPAPQSDGAAPFHALRLCEEMAKRLREAVETYARANEDFPPELQRPRLVVVLASRATDLFAPVLHEFTYQAMVHDCVELKDNTTFDYTDATGAARQYTLSESDSQWRRMRHMHLLDADAHINAEQKRFVKEHPDFYDQQQGKVYILDLTRQMLTKDLVFAQEREIFGHAKLVAMLGEANGTRRLAEMLLVEQDCALFGVRRDGDRVKRVVDEALPVLADQEVPIWDRFRLVLVYALYRGGLVEADFRKLLQFSGVAPMQEHQFMLIVHQFALLGYPIVKAEPKLKGHQHRVFHRMNNRAKFDTLRFEPAVANVVREHSNHTLDELEWPFHGERPMVEDAQQATTLRNQRAKAQWGNSLRFTPARQRVICFVAGGMTYSEMRAAQETGTELDKEVYIGGTELVTPAGFLQQVEMLGKEVGAWPVKPYVEEKPRRAPEHLWERAQRRPSGPAAAASVPSGAVGGGRAPVVQTPSPPPVVSTPTPPSDKEKKRLKLKKMFR